jgi:cytochrome c
MPLVGGTTKEDMKSGRVAALGNNSQPQRTTLMKVPTVSTLWDYINRAMPWTAPKTLSTDEVYAVTAYLLNLGQIVPDNFTLSDKNIADVQKTMPNRHGMTQAHGLWKTNGKADVKNAACMTNCGIEPKIHSELPDFARGAHGNLAQQNRTFGPVRGVDTAQPAEAVKIGATAQPPATVKNASAGTAASVGTTAPASAKPAELAKPADNDGLRLVKQHACTACHGMSNKIVGPGFTEIAGKYQGKAGAEAQMIAKVKNGGSGAWGPIPMPPQTHINDAEIKSMVGWIMSGAKAETK